MTCRWKRTVHVIFFCLLLMAGDESSDAAAAETFAVSPGQRQLFLDDVGLEKTEGVLRKLLPAARAPNNPVLTADEPWEQYCSQYGTVLFDDKSQTFRMWYLTIPRDRGLKVLDLGEGRLRAPHTTLVGYAESTDGRRWKKPKIGDFSYDGNKANNLLTLGIDNCEGLSVLHEPHDYDPARRYKCIYWDHGSGGYEERDGKPFSKDGPRDGLYAATSADGIHWKSVSDSPVIAKYCDTQQNLIFDPRLKRYVAFSRFGMGRVLARSESADLVNWSDPVRVLACDAEDGAGAQIYGAAIDLYEGVWFALRPTSVPVATIYISTMAACMERITGRASLRWCGSIAARSG
jgi:hypothetical protein